MPILLNYLEFIYITGYYIVFAVSDVNECSTKPCQNDAICGDGINTYNCICVGPWQGTNCNLGSFIILAILI